MTGTPPIRPSWGSWLPTSLRRYVLFVAVLYLHARLCMCRAWKGTPTCNHCSRGPPHITAAVTCLLVAFRAESTTVCTRGMHAPQSRIRFVIGLIFVASLLIEWCASPPSTPPTTATTTLFKLWYQPCGVLHLVGHPLHPVTDACSQLQTWCRLYNMHVVIRCMV